jgi:hypothetical protein
MRGYCGALTACFWVLKNMPLFELYFSGCPVLGIGIRMGAVAAVLDSGASWGASWRPDVAE